MGQYSIVVSALSGKDDTLNGPFTLRISRGDRLVQHRLAHCPSRRRLLPIRRRLQHEQPSKILHH